MSEQCISDKYIRAHNQASKIFQNIWRGSYDLAFKYYSHLELDLSKYSWAFF